MLLVLATLAEPSKLILLCLLFLRALFPFNLILINRRKYLKWRSRGAHGGGRCRRRLGRSLPWTGTRPLLDGGLQEDLDGGVPSLQRDPILLDLGDDPSRHLLA